MELLGITITEWTGYIAMILLLISFMMKDVKRLRIINSIACAFFVVYGFLLATSWPIIISNGAIIVINLYYLFVKKNA
ncbi:MAG: YgjV family protein [Flavobacteriaceae bacterium]|nr:YgjV family protein [Flavobacteriaceae bacterium]